MNVYSGSIRATDEPQVLGTDPIPAKLYCDPEWYELERKAAGHRARLAYTAYAGFLQLSLQLGLPRLSHEEFDDYVAHTIATLIPE